MGYLAHLDKLTLIRGKGPLSQKNWAFEVFTMLLSHRSDNKDYKNFLGFNKPSTRLSKAPNLKAPTDVA